MRIAALITTATLVMATTATPVLAQDRLTRDHARGYDQNLNRLTRDIYDDRQSNTGFWPGDVAANVVGGAVTTAGAIAAAPFHDSYASYGGPSYGERYAYDGFGPRFGTDQWNARYRNSYQGRVARGATPARNGTYATNMIGATYAERNGFVCQPGTWFTGQDGRQHICQ